MKLGSVIATMGLAVSLQANIRLPGLIADHMVLQRDAPVRIWGWADPGEVVHVSFRQQTRSTTTDERGQWQLFLDPLTPDRPADLTIAGRNRIVVRDVLIGEVWVASGQSNMEFQLQLALNGEAEVAQANFPKIRLFDVERRTAGTPTNDVGGRWKQCTPDAARTTSAVGYFFARDLHRALGVPIGIIHSSWRGSAGQTWVSHRALESEPGVKFYLDEWNAALAEAPKALARWEAEMEQGRQTQPRAPRKPPSPGDARAPSGLYNAMIAPLTCYRIRGVIWYQGESNAESERDAYSYRSLFPLLIEDWREAWKQGSFPFLFVQLANMTDRPWWPLLRESQSMALRRRDTAMAAAIDLGDPNDGHPKNKQGVGLRLALAARAVAYGQEIPYTGPVVREVTREGDRIRVWFDHTGAGLEAKGGALRGFRISGKDGRLVPAQARIERNTVIVWSEEAPAPVAVRYAWADHPDANLYNKDGLPAAPFRSDTDGDPR